MKTAQEVLKDIQGIKEQVCECMDANQAIEEIDDYIRQKCEEFPQTRIVNRNGRVVNE